MPGPADLGQGTWPEQSFSHLPDPAQRAVCELLQEVVQEIERRIAPRAEVQRHDLPSRRDLARRAGIGHDSLNDFLLGRVWPRTDRLIKITIAANITLGVL